MSPTRKLAAFAVVLVVLFGVGLLAGSVLDPSAPSEESGHLVALREGDLAFLHVHPEEVR